MFGAPRRPRRPGRSTRAARAQPPAARRTPRRAPVPSRRGSPTSPPAPRSPRRGRGHARWDPRGARLVSCKSRVGPARSPFGRSFGVGFASGPPGRTRRRPRRAGNRSEASPGVPRRTRVSPEAVPARAGSDRRSTTPARPVRFPRGYTRSWAPTPGLKPRRRLSPSTSVVHPRTDPWSSSE